jgi:hypothetical protein
MNTLGERIAKALTDPIKSDELSTLIADVEVAIEQTSELVLKERKKALDPLIVLDANKARAAIEVAEFERDRLRNAMLPLQEKLIEVQMAEHRTKWEPEYATAKAQRDECATHFAELYPKLVGELVDLFRRVDAVDAECARVNGIAPGGEVRRLAGVELTARGLGGFDRENPSLTQQLQLPDFERSSRLTWPPPKIPLALLAATPVPFDRAYSGEWWQDVEARNEQRRAENVHVAAHYNEEARARAARE